MNSKIYLAIVPLLAVGTVPAVGQNTGTTVSATAQATAQARTPQARIAAAMRTAAEANIPTSLLESKVAEGEAKRVPRERIAMAVEARLGALLRASEAMNRARIETGNAAEISVTADALEAGVSESALIRVYRNAPTERRVVAVAVLTDLVRLGNGSEPSSARVNAALGTSVALANLQAEVAAQLRAGGLGSTLDAAGGVGAGLGGRLRVP